jgi:hypothetical protein
MTEKKEDSFWVPNWGPLLAQTTVEDDLVELLLKKGLEARRAKKKKQDARHKLAGMIEQEYDFIDYEKWFYEPFNPYVSSYVQALANYGVNFKISPSLQWDLSSLWINYQKQNEYNPPHNHSGHLSFVLFLKTPKEIADEYDEQHKWHNNSGPGMLVFDFGIELLFSIHRLKIQPKVGDLIIFPAWLPHHVYGFKSNVERISVSGNIRLLEQTGPPPIIK